MKIKVVVVYRVAQFWRIPLFEDLSRDSQLDFTLIHFQDFVGTKVISGDTSSVNSLCLPSLNLTFSFMGRKAYLPFSRQLLYTLRQLSPDIVVCEGASNLLMNLVCFAYCKTYRKKIVQWSLGSLPTQSLLSRVLLFPFSFIERFSDAALVYSSRGLQHFKQLRIPSGKIFCAVNSIDNRHIAQVPYGLNPSSFNIIYVGAMTSAKKPDLLLHAFSLLLPLLGKDSDYFKSAHLTFVGDGDLFFFLQDLSIKLCVNPYVTFCGRQTGEALSSIFSAQHLLVMPGLGGLVVSEAISHGIPVLASTGDGSEVDWLRNGCGLVKKMSSSKDILDILLELARGAPNSLLQMHLLCSLSSSRYGYHSYYKSIKECLLQVSRSIE